jgi:single-stranded DNA-binding protein
MEVNGTIKFKGETVDVGTSGFQKRELVVTTEEQYPQHISIDFVQDKCNLLENYVIGDKVAVGINLRGREWTNPQGEIKYFNSIQGWNIKKTSTAPAPVAQAKKYIHIATDATYEAYKNAGWSDEQLVANGKGKFETATVPQATAVPSAPTPPAQKVSEEEHDDLPF